MRTGDRRNLPALIVAAIAALAFLLIDGNGDKPPRDGCPAAADRVGADCFDREPRGPVAGVREAADRCAARGGFLPTPAELRRARATIALGAGGAGGRRLYDAYFREAGDGAVSRARFLCVYRRPLIIP